MDSIKQTCVYILKTLASQCHQIVRFDSEGHT